jgi:HK97 family phage prohead protease
VKVASTKNDLGEGEYRAIVSAFGNVDAAGDVVMPGAFTDTLAQWEASGKTIPLMWSHEWGDAFGDIGEVLDAAETETGLEIHAKIDLENPTGRQVYKRLKGGRLDNHSFAYEVLDAAEAERDGRPVTELRKLDLIECGPCMVGANRQTPVLEIKTAIPASSGPSSTTDAAWDGPKMKANLSNDAGKDTYRKAFAWVDPDGDPDKKASYSFIHHMVSDSGAVGAANVKACVTGIGVLNGGRGGSNIPDADRKAVYSHLAKHIKDSGDDPPDLKAAAELPTKTAVTLTVPAEAVDALKAALDAATQTSEVSTSETEPSGSDAKQETGQPDSAAANDQSREAGSSAAQPQSARSAQVAARLKMMQLTNGV